MALSNGFHWRFPASCHDSVVFPKGLSLSQWISTGIIQWTFSDIFPMKCHFRDFWCVMFCPEETATRDTSDSSLRLARLTETSNRRQRQCSLCIAGMLSCGYPPLLRCDQCEIIARFRRNPGEVQAEIWLRGFLVPPPRAPAVVHVRVAQGGDDLAGQVCGQLSE